MKIEVLRIGQRVVRDDRVTTHVALVSRAFGVSKILLNEVNPDIKKTIFQVNKNWGGNFNVEFIDGWKNILKSKKDKSFKIVHLTMYGENINAIAERIEQEKKILIVVGAEKVPREIYNFADYNVAIGNQPHSEISALAVLLDRIQHGKQFQIKYDSALRRVIPTKKGKKVVRKTIE